MTWCDSPISKTEECVQLLPAGGIANQSVNGSKAAVPKVKHRITGFKVVLISFLPCMLLNDTATGNYQSYQFCSVGTPIFRFVPVAPPNSIQRLFGFYIQNGLLAPTTRVVPSITMEKEIATTTNSSFCISTSQMIDEPTKEKPTKEKNAIARANTRLW